MVAAWPSCRHVPPARAEAVCPAGQGPSRRASLGSRQPRVVGDPGRSASLSPAQQSQPCTGVSSAVGVPASPPPQPAPRSPVLLPRFLSSAPDHWAPCIRGEPWALEGQGGLPRPTALPSPALEEVAGWGQGSQAGMWGSQPTNQARVLRQGPWPSRRARLCRVAGSLPPVPPPAGASGTADRCRARSPHRGAPRAPRTHASPWPRAPHPGRAGCQGSQCLPAGRYGPRRSMTACRQWPEHSHLRPGPLPVPGPPSPSQASRTRGPARWRRPDVQARRASARLTGRQVSAPLPSGHPLLRA